MQQTGIEAIAEAATKWLTQLMELMGYSASVNAEFVADIDSGATGSNCWLTIDHSGLRPHQIQALIGVDGVSLDAIQQLANIALNADLPSEDAHCFFTIELNGYRAERQAELKQLADQAANQVRQTQQPFEIKDLTAAERRLVHMFLKEYPDLETFSQGKEPHRLLIVKPSLS
jgi:spoIIIJ-associated protein